MARQSGWVDPKKGGIPVSLDSHVQCTVATLSPDKYPPSGQQFFKDYNRDEGKSFKPLKWVGARSAKPLIERSRA